MKFRGLALGLTLLATAAPHAVLAQSATPKPAARPAQPAAARPATTPAQPARPAQITVPDNITLLIMIRSTLEALNQANLTNNYSVFYLMGSNALRQSTNPQALAQAFAPFRERRISLYPALVLSPQLTRPAAIENGRLHLTGFLPSTPSRITFDIFMDPEQGVWKPFAVNVGLAPVQQAQRQPAPQQPPQRPRQ